MTDLPSQLFSLRAENRSGERALSALASARLVTDELIAGHGRVHCWQRSDSIFLPSGTSTPTHARHGFLSCLPILSNPISSLFWPQPTNPPRLMRQSRPGTAFRSSQVLASVSTTYRPAPHHLQQARSVSPSPYPLAHTPPSRTRVTHPLLLFPPISNVPSPALCLRCTPGRRREQLQERPSSHPSLAAVRIGQEPEER